LVQRSRVDAPPEHQPSEEDRRRKAYMLDLEHNGANASVWQNLHNKFFLMGGDIKEELDVDHSGGGYDPRRSSNPLQHVFQQHNELASFDRQDTYYSLVTGQGEVRPRKRMPITATLTPEIAHPNDPSRVSSFEAYRNTVNWANEAQIAAAQKQHRYPLGHAATMKRYYDSEFFHRAPGQSFRYE
jgi:hypothetical protein